MDTVDLTIAIETVSFEYFLQCVNNGATVEQAKSEMLSPNGQKKIAEMDKAILK